MATNKSLRLWTCFWGDKHLDLFEKALVRSLSWPLNRAALQERNALWEIWSLSKDFPVIADIAKEVGIAIKLNEADSFIADLNSKYLSDSGVMMNEMWKISIKNCLESDSQMLIAPPDTIFGGDSIANILQAGEQPGTVVFVVHTRVLPEILNAMEMHKSVGNPNLVYFALTNAHKSFTEAEFGKERINTHIGGIFWKRRPNGVIAVSHRLPTPYLINWTKTDLDFFSRDNGPGNWPPVFGELDHLYPSVCVYPQERARVIGSSDDAFICEITEPDANVPALMNYDKEDPDRFWRQALHNGINRQFNVTLRPE